jgi:hypothetical protein
MVVQAHDRDWLLFTKTWVRILPAKFFEEKFDTDEKCNQYM